MDITSLNTALTWQHHACQHIARAGKYLLPAKADDSHTNMKWNRPLKAYTGNELAGTLQVGLSGGNLNLLVISDKSIVNEFDLKGKTDEEALEWLKVHLNKHGVLAQGIQMDMHYDIGSMPNPEQVYYPIHEGELTIATQLRDDANLMLTGIAGEFKNTEKVRIWPHHFDSGSMIILEEKNGIPNKSIGFGWAIADKLHPEPYFYVNFHDASSPLTSITELPGLAHGKWIELNTFKGAIVGFSEYNRKDTGQQIVYQFFHEAIEVLKNKFAHQAEAK